MQQSFLAPQATIRRAGGSARGREGAGGRAHVSKSIGELCYVATCTPSRRQLPFLHGLVSLSLSLSLSLSRLRRRGG